MERTIAGKLIWPRSKNLSENAICARRLIVRNRRETLRVLTVGSPDMDQALTRLPDLFLQKECLIIKVEKKVSVVRIPLAITGKITSIYVKQHNALSLAHRLASVVYPSAATRSFSGAAILLKKGYATAPPIAAVEYRHWGVLTKSFYVSEEIPEAKTIETFWRNDLAALKGIAGYLKTRDVLGGLARLFKSLHEDGIYHNDLKSSNILVLDGRAASDAMFRLIDLQGLRKCFFVSRRRRIKNLGQLNRTLGIHLTRTEKLVFLKAYGDYRFLNRNGKRNLVRRILDETNRQILREKSRHRIAATDPFVEALPAEADERAETPGIVGALQKGALFQMISER